VTIGPGDLDMHAELDEAPLSTGEVLSSSEGSGDVAEAGQ